MIKINNFIFNENSVMQIDKCCGGLTIQVENGSIHIDDATFEDIEWNYENNISESLSYDLAKARIEELEEENKKLKEDVSFKDKEIDRLEGENKKLKECYCNRTDCSGRIKDSKKYESLQQRIDKAIEHIEELFILNDDNVTYEFKNNEIKPLLKILKGEK